MKRLFVALPVVLLVAACSGDDDNATDDTTPTTEAADDGASDAEFVAWEIRLTDFADGEVVRLTGELPNGYPTKTIVDGEVVEAEPDGVFAWTLAESDTDVPLPTPVWVQTSMNCAQLADAVDMWTGLAEGATTDAARYRELAYAQHAIDLQTEQGC